MARIVVVNGFLQEKLTMMDIKEVGVSMVGTLSKTIRFKDVLRLYE